ncbi:hypothetical protein B0H63DRAFT_149415 [Podospora didyma]|uniref:Rab-GAP TBC domain-containing protein n=1 Tax=Podospora didyma TaxID=330526 RepID=A0AAE0NTA9_9PEZI|nr:hypothetical protein B0H63DRAFT_149415 [Podospora didyma]
MAPPQKFASVRHKTRPPARLAPFRDDTSLVALRYEQTRQAELPIPLPPPRNPLRISRPQSTLAGPIIISPPPVAPPQDQHPLFRTQLQTRSQADDWKRDSGAPTSSSITLREDHDDDVVFRKLLGDISDSPSAPSNDEQTLRDASSTIKTPCTTPPLKLSAAFACRADATQEHSTKSPTEESAQPPASPSRPISLTKKLGKTFSLRSSGTKLRKKTLSDDKVASPDAPPSIMRGSPSSMSPKPSPPRSARSSPGKGRDSSSSQPPDTGFIPISTLIPDDSLWDDFGNLSFSKRGSIMFGAKSGFPGFGSLTSPTTVAPLDDSEVASPLASLSDGASSDKPHAPPQPHHESSPSVPSIRVMSVDIERESQKVRSLYESGEGLNWQDGVRISFGERLEPTEEVPSDEEENVVLSRPLKPQPSDHHTVHSPNITTPRSVSSLSQRRDSQAKREYEWAGGVEDWEDVEGADVDRYGFISHKRPGTPELKSSQFSPRRSNVLTKRPGSAYSPSPGGQLRPPSRKVSARSLNTFTSEYSTVSRRSTRSSIRSAVNYLPHHKDRRWMDEASNMLALQPGAADDGKTDKAVEAMKRKELERSEKWRKMAKVIKKEQAGQGMDFEFDTKNPKLIERTWKGIPDCWRAAAWYSFLGTSAKTWKSSETDEQLMANFRRLQDVASSDDVQIDLDVPRTINGHIMFRRRYRGGQRLLFRVLHAISLYFPETGYVQGMASLAATLLCYYDEERCFVMLVRLWRYRSLGILYHPGFGGLMAALRDFEKRWLAGKDMAIKLNELAIDATAYGTRWYLTLFNLSIPFPAQLRVWDVFMLMGECPPEEELPSSSQGDGETNDPPPKGLDILHATSAALIHALRDVLLDSDFENAMKALTAWIPIKDEDLLMKVTRAEWRQHQGKKKDKV